MSCKLFYGILSVLLLVPDVLAWGQDLTDTMPACYRNDEYGSVLRRALLCQMEADSLQRSVETLTRTLPNVPEKDKQGIKIMIRDDHAQAVSVLKMADEWFAYAGKIEGNVSGTAGIKEQPDQIIVETTEIESSEAVNEFSILNRSPYSAANPIPDASPLPDGVVYKIQLGAFSKPVDNDRFKGLSPLAKETLTNGIIKYYVGQFSHSEQVDQALQQVHAYGYKDAFITAFYNGKPMNLARARQLEGK